MINDPGKKNTHEQLTCVHIKCIRLLELGTRSINVFAVNSKYAIRIKYHPKTIEMELKSFVTLVI